MESLESRQLLAAVPGFDSKDALRASSDPWVRPHETCLEICDEEGPSRGDQDTDWLGNVRIDHSPARDINADNVALAAHHVGPIVIAAPSIVGMQELAANALSILRILCESQNDTHSILPDKTEAHLGRLAVQESEGDYNGNGYVEQSDLDLVLLNWGSDTAGVPAGWMSQFPTGAVDQDELDGILLNWGASPAASAPTPRHAAFAELGEGSPRLPPLASPETKRDIDHGQAPAMTLAAVNYELF